MASPHSLFQALLRPAVLQILRATGFHSTRPAVVDSLTDLAARYLALLCRATASHAAANKSCHADLAHLSHPAGPLLLACTPYPPQDDDAPAPGIADFRMALQDLGALAKDCPAPCRRLRPPLPPPLPVAEYGGEPDAAVPPQQQQQHSLYLDPEEDLKDVQDFIAWFSGDRMRDIQASALADGETEVTDYLNALKKKHSKTSEESKYNGTILGRGNEQGEVHVEGGKDQSIQAWMDRMMCAPSLGSDSPRSSSPLNMADGRDGDVMDLDMEPGSRILQ